MENEKKPNLFQKIAEIIKKKKLLFIIIASVLVLAIAGGICAAIFLLLWLYCSARMIFLFSISSRLRLPSSVISSMSS
jgi:flagellar basal body-associated protein FliL